MGFRFRKRIRLAKGIFWNIGKKGSSLSIGRRGATMNLSKKGAPGYFLAARDGGQLSDQARAGDWMFAAVSGSSGVHLRTGLSHPTCADVMKRVYDEETHAWARANCRIFPLKRSPT